MTQSSSYKFFSTCPKGVEDLLEREAEQLGLTDIVQSKGGISFSGDLDGAYRLCLWSRVASRVLLQLSEFEISDYDDLYNAVQNIDWASHLSNDGSFSVDCFASHDTITNSHFATLKIKDAIVDQFKEKTGSRPDVERALPDIRVNVYIKDSGSIIYLDLTGEPLHKRGYRKSTSTAPLRESLAAAILLRCKWPEMAKQGAAFCDPMCGSGTLLIEAALMAAGIAPGLYRNYYGFINWKQHQPDIWEKILQEAEIVRAKPLQVPVITGADISGKVIEIAKNNIRDAGLNDVITLSQNDISIPNKLLAETSGLLVVNPPYGKRMGSVEDLDKTYSNIGQAFKKNYQGWTAAVFTSESDLARQIGMRSHHKNTLYNGALKCTLYQYTIRQSHDVPKDNDAGAVHANADMFRNRLKKNLKHIRRWAKKNSINCYRVYDADIPQYSMAIDLYDDWVHVQEYEPPKSINTAKAIYRLSDAIEHISAVLELDVTRIVVKRRKKQSGKNQYGRHEQKNQSEVIIESGLKFSINLFDYLDTGIFLDHRNVRRLIKKYSSGKSFLNLFCYTGTASVYAAAGGATATTSIDMSNTYLAWARANLSLNGFDEENNQYVRADCMQWLQDAKDTTEKYQLILLDPPTFSNSKKMSTTLDIQRDHVELIELAMHLLDDDGMMIFSCNARRFSLDEMLLKHYSIQDVTSLTIPEDFKRKPLHKCWCLHKSQQTQRVSLDP